MKKKNLNIFLFFLLIFIWGAIIKKYFIKQDDILVDNEVKKLNLSSQGYFMKSKADFNLNILVNPFKKSKINNQKKSIKVSDRKSSKFKANSRDSNSKIQFPEVKYYGFVKRKKSKNPLILIKIDGKLHRIKPNERVNGVSIISVNKDSVKLLFKDQINVVKKINI